MQPGQLLTSRYRLEQRLAAGGMSVVWRAHDEVLDRPVAVKVLTPPYASTSAQVGRVRDEAQAAARLWHPNVTSVYDYGEAIGGSGERLPYVVMELLSGPTLSQRLTYGPLPAAVALDICADIAAALADAHAHGVVHRDVKPSNVMLTSAGAKVLDFGIAARAGEPDAEVDGTVLGSPTYLAPERLAGLEVVPESDVFALGVLMYQALSGDLPWPAGTTNRTVAAHENDPPSGLPPIDGVPDEVRHIVERCLAKDPRARPPASEVVAILRKALRAAGVATPTVPLRSPVVPVGSGPARRARTPARVGAAVLVALTGLTVAVLVVDADPRRSGAPAPGPVAPASTAPTPTRESRPPTRESGPGKAGETTPAPSRANQPAPATLPPPTTATTSRPAPATEVTALGGVARIVCANGLARLEAVDANPGYVVKQTDAGPATEVRVVLRSADNDSEIRVTCEGGSARSEIRENSR